MSDDILCVGGPMHRQRVNPCVAADGVVIFVRRTPLATARMVSLADVISGKRPMPASFRMVRDVYELRPAVIRGKRLEYLHYKGAA